jgi:arylsulfatase
MIPAKATAAHHYAAACALVLAILLFGCAESPPRPPNLLLITVDTLRPDRLGCYGGEADVGEAICSLADPGERYLWAISPAPSTAPAVASILTSRYPAAHRVTQFAVTRLPARVRTLAESLAEAGYATAAVVSNPVLGVARNLGQGFEVYDFELNRVETNRPGLRERDAADATDTALAWLDGARKPWFLWLHYQDPHGPYEPPGSPPIRDAPGARKLPLLRDHSGHRGIPAYQRIPQAFSAEVYEQRYRDEIRYLDEHIRRLLDSDAVRDSPIAVMLTADHAEAFGEDDYWFAHGHSLGLEQVRVPLLWRPADATRSQSIPTPVTTLDVAPTLLAAAGVPIPSEFQGVPLGQAEAAAPRALYTEHRKRVGVLADGVYYARDRKSLKQPVRDRITGGWLQPLPPRSARLGPDGALPETAEPATDGVDARLEPLLADFLARAGKRRDPADDVPSPELSEQLRALGYLE